MDMCVASASVQIDGPNEMFTFTQWPVVSLQQYELSLGLSLLCMQLC